MLCFLLFPGVSFSWILSTATAKPNHRTIFPSPFYSLKPKTTEQHKWKFQVRIYSICISFCERKHLKMMKIWIQAHSSRSEKQWLVKQIELHGIHVSVLDYLGIKHTLTSIRREIEAWYGMIKLQTFLKLSSWFSTFPALNSLESFLCLIKEPQN